MKDKSLTEMSLAGAYWVEDAALEMGLHPETIRRWIRAGAPHTIAPSGRYVVDPDDLMRWKIRRAVERLRARKQRHIP